MYCRGQCYNGPANLFRHITWFQKRINGIMPHVLSVHLSVHTLNLVVQDDMITVDKSRKFLFLIKFIIKIYLIYVKNSPKINQFLTISRFKIIYHQTNIFCPTRWSMQIVSLKIVCINYATMIEF